MSYRIGVISLGCSKNRVNSEQMMFLLDEAGHQVSGETDGADIVLINTCGFIESAKTEAVETILELAAAKQAGSIGKIVVAGCLPQRYKDDILTELPEIDAVIGTGSFDDVVNVIESHRGTVLLCDLKNHTREPSPCVIFGDINAPVSETDRIISTSPLWAYLKIAEGCDNNCAYCCIPSIRGKYRSRPMENIVTEAEKLVERGIRELIIVAQDVTNYGIDIYSEYKLAALLTELNNIGNLKWIRLHYLYPDRFDDALIDVISKSGKILKYLDIPVQHINDGILKKMQRRGSSRELKILFKRLREEIPGVVFRTSLITGLPGEGEKEFSQLCEFLEEVKFERVGVFAYSPEAGTAAAKMGRPPKKVAEKRAEKLLELQAEIMQNHHKNRIGSIETVLVENMTTNIRGVEYYLARSYAESPEIDGYILIDQKNVYEITQENRPPVRTPVRFEEIQITEIINGQLVGEYYQHS